MLICYQHHHTINPIPTQGTWRACIKAWQSLHDQTSYPSLLIYHKATFFQVSLPGTFLPSSFFCDSHWFLRFPFSGVSTQPQMWSMPPFYDPTWFSFGAVFFGVWHLTIMEVIIMTISFLGVRTRSATLTIVLKETPLSIYCWWQMSALKGFFQQFKYRHDFYHISTKWEVYEGDKKLTTWWLTLKTKENIRGGEGAEQGPKLGRISNKDKRLSPDSDSVRTADISKIA